jgi:hypothetical protein
LIVNETEKSIVAALEPLVDEHLAMEKRIDALANATDYGTAEIHILGLCATLPEHTETMSTGNSLIFGGVK